MTLIILQLLFHNGTLLICLITHLNKTFNKIVFHDWLIHYKSHKILCNIFKQTLMTIKIFLCNYDIKNKSYITVHYLK